jgi:hypothetical protein
MDGGLAFSIFHHRGTEATEKEEKDFKMWITTKKPDDPKSFSFDPL